MGDSCSFDKNTPYGICDPWACSPTCFFKRIELGFYSHRSHRFAQMRCVPHAKESVRIGEITSRSVGGASPCHFFKHESRESYECRYVKRLWRLESHEICRRPTDQREVMSTEERLWFPLSSHYLPSISGASHVITSPSVSGASHVIREISNTSGVSSQWSFDRFARFVFFKITASVCICQWGFAESRKITSC